MLIGSLGSSGSHKTLGTPPSKPKNTELNSNLYLTPSSGQSERSASKISNITTNLGDLGPSEIIIIQMVPAGTTDTPNSLSSASELAQESAQQSESSIRYLTRNNLYYGNYKYGSTIYFIHFYPLLVSVILG